jgi:thiol:disulfide interchange protein
MNARRPIEFFTLFSSRNFESSSMPVREISNDALNGELTTAGDKLVMVDFFATWFVCSSRVRLIVLCSGVARAKT